MDTSSEKVIGFEGNASIRLRYSTQIQGGGRTQAIDAEIMLPIGASQEMREQIIRETELGVEQLARQIAQRVVRTAESSRVQTPTSPRPASALDAASSPTIPAASRPGAGVRSQSEPTDLPVARQVPDIAIPASRSPIGESMPPAPVASAEGRTIKLADFISGIHKHLNMTPKEAMELLNVKTLEGLNYKDAFNQLRKLVDEKNASASQPDASSRTAQQTPGAEASHQAGRTTSSPSTSRPPLNQAPTTAIPSTRQPSQARVSETAGGTARTLPTAMRTNLTDLPKSSGEPQGGFAGSSKAPIPIHIGVEVVSEPPRGSYAFDEEEVDEEEFAEDEDEDFEEEYELPKDRDQERASAHLKLDRLKSIRGNQVASPERLRVLDNLVGSQISEEQLQKIIQTAWGLPNKRRLRNAQLEELISWAKEDHFVEEAEALLNVIEEGEA
jgi:hypothetical protein